MMNYIFAYLISLGCLGLAMFGNTAIATSKAKKEGTYEPKKLTDGLQEYALVFVGISCIYAIGYLMPNYTIALNGNDIVLSEAIKTLIIAAMGIYIIKAINSFIEKFKIKDVEIDTSHKKEIQNVTYESDEKDVG